MPIGLQLLAELGIFALVSILAGTMGTTAIAAHQVAIMLAASSFMVPLAVGAATSVQVGRAIGKGDVREARESGFAGFAIGGAFMLTTALIMWIFPTSMARLMTDQQEVLSLAANLIVIAGTFQIFDGLQAVGSGALRGAALTRWAMVANIVAYWIVGFPVSLWLGFSLGMGPQGLWWGLTAGLAIAAVALTLKFYAVSRRPIAAVNLG